MLNFAERLKLLRTNNNLLQKQIAKSIEISDRQYRNYEAGKIDPPASKIISLADYFNVSLDYLVGRSDDPTRH